jgi:hypothetical protein
MHGAVALLLILADASMAAAAPPPPPSDEAERRFREGLKAFDGRDYRRAIEHFQQAHRLSPMPEILFDIALAYKALGDCPRASYAFDAFFAAAPADDPLRDRATAKLRELGSCDAAAASAVARTESAAPVPVAPAAPALPRVAVDPPAPKLMVLAAPPPPSDRGPWYRRPACVASGAATVALAVTGSVLGVSALTAAREVENSAVWDDHAIRADERGRILGQSSALAFVAAGIAGLVTAGTCALSYRDR